jgi:hypothetical protein
MEGKINRAMPSILERCLSLTGLEPARPGALTPKTVRLRIGCVYQFRHSDAIGNITQKRFGLALGAFLITE